MSQRARPTGDEPQACGVLSQLTSADAREPRGVRAVAIGALLLLGVVTVVTGCAADDNNATGGAGTGGTSGTGGTGGTGGIGDSGGLGDEDGSTSCGVQSELDTYTANLTKMGKGGFAFSLLESDPGPPARGKNVWSLKVTGPDGMLVTKQLKAVADMPRHGHASPIPAVVTFDAATGTFRIDPVYLSMGGKWRIKFDVTDPNDPTLPVDYVEFFFCVN